MTALFARPAAPILKEATGDAPSLAFPYLRKDVERRRFGGCGCGCRCGLSATEGMLKLEAFRMRWDKKRAYSL